MIHNFFWWLALLSPRLAEGWESVERIGSFAWLHSLKSHLLSMRHARKSFNISEWTPGAIRHIYGKHPLPNGRGSSDLTNPDR